MTIDMDSLIGKMGNLSDGLTDAVRLGEIDESTATVVATLSTVVVAIAKVGNEITSSVDRLTETIAQQKGS